MKNHVDNSSIQPAFSNNSSAANSGAEVEVRATCQLGEKFRYNGIAELYAKFDRKWLCDADVYSPDIIEDDAGVIDDYLEGKLTGALYDSSDIASDIGRGLSIAKASFRNSYPISNSIKSIDSLFASSNARIVKVRYNGEDDDLKFYFVSGRAFPYNPKTWLDLIGDLNLDSDLHIISCKENGESTVKRIKADDARQKRLDAISYIEDGGLIPFLVIENLGDEDEEDAVAILCA